MNNEPVAWTACLNCGQRVAGDSIHTCSPQLKTLTDEEIYEVLWKHFPISDKEANANFIAVVTHCIRVALRKAQEK